MSAYWRDRAEAAEARITELEAELASAAREWATASVRMGEATEAAEAEVRRLREALTVYVEDDCRELADGEGLTDEEARLTYSPRYRWGRSALAAGSVPAADNTGKAQT
jgi:hypothetical protein